MSELTAQIHRPDGSIDVQAQRARHWANHNFVEPPAVPEHTEYPKYMTHPAYQPGTAAREVVPDPTQPWKKAYIGGTPIKNPPVLVKNEDDEAWHASRGYVSQGKSDAAAFARAVAAPVPMDDYTPERYPMWVGDKLVHDEAEERAALGMVAQEPESAPEPLDPEKEMLRAQLAELQDRLAALTMPAPGTPLSVEPPGAPSTMDVLQTPEMVAGQAKARAEIDALRRDLEAAGVDVDKRWGIARLREELEKATAPEATTA